MSLADALGTDHSFGVRDAAQHDDVDMEDLFGEDDGAAAPPTAATGLSDASPAPVLDEEEQRRQHLEYNEDEGEPDPDLEQKVEAQLEIPDVPFPRSSDGKYWIIRLPNYLKLDARPFAPEVYNGVESEEGDPETAKERSMSIKLEVENTIRWRWVRGPNGEMVRQSNTRFIRWSDGSLSLQLGKELFDVNQNVEPVAQQSQSSQAESQSAHTPSGTGSLTYLVAQHKRAEILQAEALVTGQLSVRPVSMQSETHRRLVRALSQKHSKTARILLDDGRAGMFEPRAAQPKAKRARRPRDPDAQPSRRKSRMSRAADVWSDDDDLGLEETLYGRHGDDDDGTPRKDRAKPKKRRRDDGEDHAEDYKTDDFVVADTSDEDDDSPGKKRKKKSRAQEDMDDAPDELEEMDKAIERRENERRKKAAAASKKAAAESAPPPPKVDDHQSEDMDVESEEEDDMPRVVRKPAPGKRKVAFEDEEDE
ncbi:hypothetical protein AURDEDRAFT_151178 [Auricularia subglabra TFB-10046 SS5]|nr:hypothetical protein AURDEDRAFT_151178 [Auricularia subglabra TFB-10046 SS5]